MRRLRRFIGSIGGGAAVELAVVFPVILLLIIAIVDYGRLFYTAVTVSNAARAGAEYGQQDFSTETDTATMRVVTQADGAEAGALTIQKRWYCECGAGVANNTCAVCPGGGYAPQVYVEVIATKDITTLLNYPGLPSSFTVTRKATFRSQ